MKLLVILISLIVCCGSNCYAEDEFSWSENQNGIDLGVRAEEVEKFGRKLLVVQAALRNESDQTFVIQTAQGYFPNLRIDVTRFGNDKSNEIVQTYNLIAGDLRSNTQLASRSSSVIIVKPMETFVFPLFSADLKWTKFTALKFRAIFDQKVIPESTPLFWIEQDADAEFGLRPAEKPVSYSSAILLEAEFQKEGGQQAEALKP